jgi:hypothetical protein
MGFIDAIFGGLGSFVIRGFNTAHQLARNYVAKLVDEALRERGVEKQPASNPTSVNVHVYNVQNDIKNNDLEQTEIEKKRAHDGSLNLSDREKLEELKKQGEDKFEQWQKAKTQEVIIEQAKNPDSYETSFLNNEKVHLLQFQMGQVVLEKRCVCGKPMMLQHTNRKDGSIFLLSDFFWSCVGFYNNNNQCKRTQSFQTQDIGLLHKANILELQLSNTELGQSFTRPLIQRTVVRLRQHLGAEDRDVLCPIHHVPMILREKDKYNHSNVVLDMFHLRCPHFQCKQTVKLKSLAQIAALLYRKEERGIL